MLTYDDDRKFKQIDNISEEKENKLCKRKLNQIYIIFFIKLIKINLTNVLAFNIVFKKKKLRV